jgi:hypothetical protein
MGNEVSQETVEPSIVAANAVAVEEERVEVEEEGDDIWLPQPRKRIKDIVLSGRLAGIDEFEVPNLDHRFSLPTSRLMKIEALPTHFSGDSVTLSLSTGISSHETISTMSTRHYNKSAASADTRKTTNYSNMSMPNATLYPIVRGSNVDTLAAYTAAAPLPADSPLVSRSASEVFPKSQFNAAIEDSAIKHLQMKTYVCNDSFPLYDALLNVFFVLIFLPAF